MRWSKQQTVEIFTYFMTQKAKKNRKRNPVIEARADFYYTNCVHLIRYMAKDGHNTCSLTEVVGRLCQ